MFGDFAIPIRKIKQNLNHCNVVGDDHLNVV